MHWSTQCPGLRASSSVWTRDMNLSKLTIHSLLKSFQYDHSWYWDESSSCVSLWNPHPQWIAPCTILGLDGSDDTRVSFKRLGSVWLRCIVKYKHPRPSGMRRGGRECSQNYRGNRERACESMWPVALTVEKHLFSNINHPKSCNSNFSSSDNQ